MFGEKGLSAGYRPVSARLQEGCSAFPDCVNSAFTGHLPAGRPVAWRNFWRDCLEGQDSLVRVAVKTALRTGDCLCDWLGRRSLLCPRRFVIELCCDEFE